mgnify:CR=1 FL=1
MEHTTLWISCGVVRKEMECLLSEGVIEGELMFWDSMLHMVPLELESRLNVLLDSKKAVIRPMVLVTGDCSPHMLNIAEDHKIARVNATNCGQMLLGKQRYRELMHEGAFIVLPEWAQRWKEIITEELGLNGEIAKEFMRENRKKLVYCDTGVSDVPHETLHMFSEYTSLSLCIEKVSLDIFVDFLRTAQREAYRLVGEEQS